MATVPQSPDFGLGLALSGKYPGPEETKAEERSANDGHDDDRRAKEAITGLASGRSLDAQQFNPKSQQENADRDQDYCTNHSRLSLSRLEHAETSIPPYRHIPVARNQGNDYE